MNYFESPKYFLFKIFKNWKFLIIIFLEKLFNEKIIY